MKNLFFTLLLLAQFRPATGQTQNPELAALIHQAFEHYPRLVEANLAAQSAAIRTDIQRAGYLPTVSAQASFQYLDPVAEAEFGQAKIRFQPHDNYNLGLTGSGLLFDFGRTKAQIDKAIAEAAVAQNSQEAVQNALAYQVAQLYYGIVFTQKQMAVQEEQLKSLRANESLISVKLKNGDALELDLLNAQVANANSQNRLTDLTATLEKQQALLTMLTGNAATQPAAAELVCLQFTAENNTAENPDLAVANAKITVAEKDLTVNRRFLRPALNYNAGLGFRNGYQPDINEFRFNWALGAGISYPLYVGGRDRLQIKLSRLNLEAARAQLNSVAEAIASDLAQAVADQRAAQAKLSTAETVISQAKNALSIAQTRFTNGVATNVDVLTAQTNLEQAQLAGVTAAYQLCLAGLQIGKLEGKKFW